MRNHTLIQEDPGLEKVDLEFWRNHTLIQVDPDLEKVDLEF